MTISNFTKLKMVAEKVAKCKLCPDLVANRTQTVFGHGNQNASVMFIAEAPGKREDEKGIPLVGQAGQLFDNMIAACGWSRSDIYTANILKCRPPHNRTPLPEESKNCRKFLDFQIRIIKPSHIVCLGAVAAQNLLDTQVPIGKLRGVWHSYKHEGETIKVICSWHPAFLLRNPASKKESWEDLKMLLDDVK